MVKKTLIAGSVLLLSLLGSEARTEEFLQSGVKQKYGREVTINPEGIVEEQIADEEYFESLAGFIRHHSPRSGNPRYNPKDGRTPTGQWIINATISAGSDWSKGAVTPEQYNEGNDFCIKLTGRPLSFWAKRRDKLITPELLDFSKIRYAFASEGQEFSEEQELPKFKGKEIPKGVTQNAVVDRKICEYGNFNSRLRGIELYLHERISLGDNESMLGSDITMALDVLDATCPENRKEIAAVRKKLYEILRDYSEPRITAKAEPKGIVAEKEEVEEKAPAEEKLASYETRQVPKGVTQNAVVDRKICEHGNFNSRIREIELYLQERISLNDNESMLGSDIKMFLDVLNATCPEKKDEVAAVRKKLSEILNDYSKQGPKVEVVIIEPQVIAKPEVDICEENNLVNRLEDIHSYRREMMAKNDHSGMLRDDMKLKYGVLAEKCPDQIEMINREIGESNRDLSWYVCHGSYAKKKVAKIWSRFHENIRNGNPDAAYNYLVKELDKVERKCLVYANNVSDTNKRWKLIWVNRKWMEIIKTKAEQITQGYNKIGGDTARNMQRD
ncbi:hypothetical protein KY339_04745 [Candidatus Woesearchaeota archaeon]|nr:hypothetical protein [Candidatus Woesearchaeota archaeon]